DTDHTLFGMLAGPELMFANLANPVALQAEVMLSVVRNLSVPLPTPQLLLLTDPGRQDLITGSQHADILTPEPSGVLLALVGAALGGGAASCLRQEAKKNRHSVRFFGIF